MKYVGSKRALAKYLVPIIQPHIERVYIEPFVGGANLIQHIKAELKLGFDSNKYLIAMWQELQQGWMPPETISEQEYINVRDNKDKYPDYYVGLVGFCATYGAKWFGGYARSFKADGVTRRDQANEGIRNILKQLPKVQDVNFYNIYYHELTPTAQCKSDVVYCDPPYANSTDYKQEFNSEDFWNWCRQVAPRVKKLFISEYTAPEDFTCIFEHEHRTQLITDRHEARVERLFVYNV